MATQIREKHKASGPEKEAWKNLDGTIRGEILADAFTRMDANEKPWAIAKEYAAKYRVPVANVGSMIRKAEIKRQGGTVSVSRRREPLVLDPITSVKQRGQQYRDEISKAKEHLAAVELRYADYKKEVAQIAEAL